MYGEKEQRHPLRVLDYARKAKREVLPVWSTEFRTGDRAMMLSSYRRTPAVLLDIYQAQLEEMIDVNVTNKIGLTAKEMRELKKVKYPLENEAADVCSICYSDMLLGTEVTELKCTHMFHPTCINTWLQKNGRCPICKLPQTDRQFYK